MATTNAVEGSLYISLPVHRLKKTLVVDNFSLIDCSDHLYPSIRSTDFQCPPDKNIDFSFHLYPRGEDGYSRDYISVYLHASVKEPKVRVQFKMSILNDRNEVAHSEGKS